MPSLNLLSPQAKKNLRSRYLFIALEDILGTLLIFAALTSALLMPVAHKLKKIQTELQQQRSTVASRFSAYNQRAKTIAEQITITNQIRQKNLPPSLIIKTIHLAKNSGIGITSLRWQQDGYVQIIGQAASRQDLVNFQNALKQFQRFKEVNIPLSNFLPKTKIDFNIVSQFIL